MQANRPNVSDPGRVIAHRGASRVAPENSLAAFRAAAAQGVHWVEFDVSRLGDGTPVMHHDATFNRCTSASGPLTAVGAGDLANIMLTDGAPVPSLDQALDLIEELGFHANLELKTHGGLPGRLTEAVANTLADRSWVHERIIVSSFDHIELAAFRRAMPKIPLGVLYNEPATDWQTVLGDLDAAALHIEYPYLTAEILHQAEIAGMDVRVFTINEPDLMAPFREAGLTSVITDHPPLFLDQPGWADWARS